MTAYLKELPADLKIKMNDARIRGRKIKTIKHYPASGAFNALNKARAELKKEGFQSGLMCMNEPIAIARGIDYISKWRNIPIEEGYMAQGVIVSADFREADVCVVEFE
jgi:hypothetical protein